MTMPLDASISANGVARPQPSPSVEDVADRFAQFRDVDDELELDDEPERGEDESIATVCTSIPNAYFRVDPRDPMPIRAFKSSSRSLYLVTAEVRVQRPDIHRYGAYLAKTRAGKLLVLCVRRPSISGQDFPAWRNMRHIASLARTEWWGMRWEEQPSGGFKLKAKPYPNITDAVTFPPGPLEEHVIAAFGDRLITSAQDARLPDIPDLTDAPEFV